ncbi:hypothetical protein [Moraxella lacunata]|uniref:hypothetical protein n=1 Tax=Moraxella lacunata TaxID=477 RepID=UPI003EE1CBAF
MWWGYFYHLKRHFRLKMQTIDYPIIIFGVVGANGNLPFKSIACMKLRIGHLKRICGDILCTP